MTYNPDNLAPRNERGYNMHHAELRRALGLNPKKLPNPEVTTYVGEVQGIKFFLHPAAPPVMKMRYSWRTGKMEPRPVKRSTHRLYGRCPGCDKSVPAGRFHQHKCKEV